MSNKWYYKIINKKTSEVTENTWITYLTASEICKWFESIGFEVVSLIKISEVKENIIEKSQFNTETIFTVIYN